MAPGLVIAVAVLGFLVAVLSFGFLMLASRLNSAEEALSAAVGRLQACDATIRRLSGDIAHLDDVTKGLARPVVDEYVSKLPADASGVKAGLETKIYGD